MKMKRLFVCARAGSCSFFIDEESSRCRKKDESPICRLPEKLSLKTIAAFRFHAEGQNPAIPHRVLR